MIKTKSYIITEYIFLISIIVASGTIFNINYSTIVTATMILSSFALLYLGNKLSIKMSALITIISISIVMLFQILFVDFAALEADIKLLIKFIAVILGMHSIVENEKDILGKIYNILIVMVCMSTAVYICIAVGIHLPQQPIQGMNYSGVLYLGHISIGNGLAGSGISLNRNPGIYWESGLHQIYLNLLLLYSLHMKKKPYVIALLLINIFLTLSPTGYITTAAIIAIYLFGRKKPNVKLVTLSLIFLVAIYFIYPWFSKFFLYKTTTGSFEWRTQDIFLGLQTFLQHPLIGVGTTQSAYKSVFYSSYGVMHGNTNGLVSILLQFGIIGGIFYITNYIRTYRYIKSQYGRLFAITFIVWLIASLMNEPIEKSEMMMLFISVGILSSKGFYPLRLQEISESYVR